MFLVDAQNAYYRVPVQPSDWKYMGLKWAKKYWVFLSLQMGLSSAPRIYTAFADAIEYIAVNRGSRYAFHRGMQQLRHYIDDFFGACPSKREADALYRILIQTFKDLGIPTREDKCTAPNTKAKILGWLYDTLKRVVGMVPKKRLELLQMIKNLLRTKKSDKKTLERIIGKIQNASLVIFPGKAFVRRLEALLYLPALRYNTPIELNQFVLADLQWWHDILSKPKCCCISFDLV